MVPSTISGGYGPDTRGLLVKVWGKVTETPLQDSVIFTIDDGRGAGLKIKPEFDCSSFSYPAKGDLIVVSGIHGVIGENVVRASKEADIQQITRQ